VGGAAAQKETHVRATLIDRVQATFVRGDANAILAAGRLDAAASL
jgi:hypothetical protein